MIPPDIRLYTWLDCEHVLRLALEGVGKWPDWFVDATAYWDEIAVRIREGSLNEAKDWFKKEFEPRVAEIDQSLFAQLELILESANGHSRTLPVVFEQTTDDPGWARPSPTLTRPPTVQRPIDTPPIPEPLPGGSPSILAFHSFKGGVGRTVHAIALAQNLATREPASVLLIDADLEAPGISWLLETRFMSPPVSFADFLALVHGDRDPDAGEAIALVAARLQDSLIDGVYVLPAFRTSRYFDSLDIRPEHLLQGRENPYVLVDLIAALGRQLGVSAVIIDLRAGLSELAAGVLLDPRAQRVFVTTLGGQSVKGTELVLNLLAKRAPSREEHHPIPQIVLNQVPRELEGTDVVSLAQEQLCAAAIQSVQGEGLRPDEVLLEPALFDQSLLALPPSWDQAMDAIRRSQIGEATRPLVQDVPKRLSKAGPESPPELDAVRSSLARADRLVFAEQGEGEDFLAISPLRNLISDHRSQLPIAVIVGAKGAGKTFTYLQVARHGSWQAFARAARGLAPTTDATVMPVLRPKNLGPHAADLWKGARARAVEALGFKTQPQQDNLEDSIREWLGSELHEGQWRDNWLDLIAWAAGFDPFRKGAGREFPARLLAEGRRLLVTFDGLEDLFQEINRDPRQQLALRALLQEVPGWLEQQPERPLGALVFVRRDMVTLAVRQNAGQLLDRYKHYALRWDRTEALRLALWVSQQAHAGGPQLEQIRDMSEPSLVEALVPVWGKKLGSDQSREGRSADWILAALSDFRGQIQARDIVRFLHHAATNSAGAQNRVLAPAAVRSAVQFCSTQKIDEAGAESPALKDIFAKLSGLAQDRKWLPFRLSQVGLTPDDEKILDDNGVTLADAGEYYIAEIFRHGLAFKLSSGKRPRVLALSRKRQQNF